jgi:hypothetical protein
VAANLSAGTVAMEEENIATPATVSAISPEAQLVDAAIVLWSVDQEDNIEDDTLLRDDDQILPEARDSNQDRVARDPAQKAPTDLTDDFDDAREDEQRGGGQLMGEPLTKLLRKAFEHGRH